MIIKKYSPLNALVFGKISASISPLVKTKREKYNAVIEHVTDLSNNGRPVLIGTTSVEISELLGRMLSIKKIKHNVLNAKLHKKEADVVTEAGKAGIVTIATNMAGRGTDIKINNDVKEKGGLAIIGTERHDSRTVSYTHLTLPTILLV